MRTALLCVLVVFSAGCLKSGAGTAPTVAAKATTMTRDEFRAKVIGKTEAEVIATVGKPMSTAEGGTRMFHYEKLTTDPVNGRVDTWITVVFENGKVTQVRF